MANVFEFCTGPVIGYQIELTPGIVIDPLPPVGAANRLDVVTSYLRSHGAELSDDFLASAAHEAQQIQPTIVIRCASGASVTSESTIEEIREGASRVFQHARRSLAIGAGEEFQPFASIVQHNDFVDIKIEYQRQKGLHIFKNGEEGKSFQLDWAQTVMKELLSERDDRYGFLIEIYQNACEQERPLNRIALFYQCLEAISAGVNRRLGGNSSRDAIRMATTYGYGSVFPIFEIEEKPPIVVDHIAIAGRVRNSLFHGGTLQEEDLDKDNRIAYPLLMQRPDIFAFALALDCLLILLSWPNGHFCKRTWYNEPVGLPTRTLGRSTDYRTHIFSQGKLPARTAGVIARRGGKKGEVFVAMVIQNFSAGPMRLQFVIPPGAEPEKPGFEPGYKLRFVDEPMSSDRTG